MAVTKIWQIKDSLSRVLDYAADPEKTKTSDLEQVIRYAADEEKVSDENERFFAVTGVNCRAETAFEEMRSVQERFGKRGGNVAYHAYQSFKTGEVTAEQCHRLGVELAQKMWGDKYQVLVATHFNTGTYHNHFVVNAVGMWDGKKYDCSKREYYRMRRLSDEMCEREGLTVISDPAKKKTPRQIYFAEKNGEPTKYNLMREAIDYAMSLSWDHNSFVYAMKKQGYIVNLDTRYKYATIRSVNAQRGTRLFRLGEKYDRPAIYARLEENARYDRQNVEDRFSMEYEKYSQQWVRYHPPDREYEYRKRFYYMNVRNESLVEIYVTLFVLLLDIAVQAIRLTYEILRDQTNTPEYVIAAQMRPRSPEMLEAARSLERRERQMMLMSIAKFKTEYDVREYISQREADIAEAKRLREHWRNKLRRATDPAQIAEYKKKRDKCTEFLTRLRLQRNTAQTILNDIPQVRRLLEAEQNVQRGTDPYEVAKGYKMKDAINGNQRGAR